MALFNIKKRIAFFVLLVPLSLLFSSVSSAANSLRVMTFNIMQLGYQDWDQSNRLQHTPNAIRQLSNLPDVIIFNEAFTDSAYSTITSHLADLYPYSTPVVGQNCSGYGWNSLNGNCSNGVVVIRGGVFIMSRYPITEQHAYVYRTSHSKTWDYWANKGAALVKINKNGMTYNVVGTHLQADENDAPDAHTYRMNQLKEMNSWIKNTLRVPAYQPVIIAGDLNVEFSKSHHVNEMKAACQCQLNYTQSNYGSFSSSTNWVAKANAYSSGFSLFYNDTLDYVMSHNDYRQPRSTTNMEVIPLKSNQSWYWSYLRGSWGHGIYSNGYYSDLSDHYPVVSTFHF
ncbi:sphingomyelin phosphodiesterase [Spartinivicinus poritis]|uniref:Sphingomyelin phosphodiesterase n=1 Tax=Spartinivicinus poritis TaxID=2994640 RepID=A0ABT5U454_9GAMM|nr:sphingomyelin phosphodiesterase [Spartinivicinus sp. A2-2]MDE1461152.1 sphingomyelin phosphodiesterase [Spartinivicinus sp. A2-2]